MNQKIRALGIALVATLALTAVTASTAQAQFTSDASHTSFFGSQSAGATHSFTAGTGVPAISCNNIVYAGTTASTSSSTLAVAPGYGGCVDTLGRTVDVTKNSLVYTFKSGAGKGTMEISGELVLTVTGSTHCTILVQGPQTVSGITYHNLGGTQGFEITSNTANIKTKHHGGFFACGTKLTESTNGTYTGTTRMSGENTSTHAAASISVD